MNRPSFWSGWLMGGLIGGLLGYALGGFVAMVVLIVGGVQWWTVAMFGVVGLLACLAGRWLWTRWPAGGPDA